MEQQAKIYLNTLLNKNNEEINLYRFKIESLNADNLQLLEEYKNKNWGNLFNRFYCDIIKPAKSRE